jgi:hypothetical protein
VSLPLADEGAEAFHHAFNETVTGRPAAPTSAPVLGFRPRTIEAIRPQAAASGSEPAQPRPTTSALDQAVTTPLPVVAFPTPRTWMKVLQKWEGVVEDIRDGEFDAVLRDCTDPTRDSELTTLPIEEVPPGDRELLKAGATFYWVIGYRDSLGGGRRRESEIRMRRLPITRGQLDHARGVAEELRARLGWA